jgi:hypothetical protein
LLKSLVLQDQGGGQVGTVTYDNRDPVDKTLKSFAIDLTSHPSLVQLLGQVRGEEVEVATLDKGVTAKVTGKIVGVEKQWRPVGNQTVMVEQLNLLTGEGLRGVPLDQVQRVRLSKPELEQELRKALELLATAHDSRKKTVSLNFTGVGRRNVRVGYVTESPVWKTSYRLSLDRDKAFLQGWAIVENTTDEDWKQVKLGLVSGRPVSYQMDLYEPLYVRRPVVEPELFASLRPTSYSGSLLDDSQAKAGEQKAAEARPRSPARMPLRAGMPGLQGQSGGILGGGGLGQLGNLGLGGGGQQNLGVQGGAGQQGGGGQLGIPQGVRLGGLPHGINQPSDEDPGEHRPPDKDAKEFNFREGVVSAAAAMELGEYFQYQIEQPVSLPRQKSALLPIVNRDVKVSRVSIYNPAVHPKYPMHGLRFNNTSGLHLMQGPIAVFDGGSYCGDSQLPDLQPRETRLVSYAVDLGTEVAAEEKPFQNRMTAVRVFKGVIHSKHQYRRTTGFEIKNRSEHERLVLIEHPVVQEFTLVAPAKPAERSRDYYRFEVRLAPGKSARLEVVEEMTYPEERELSNSNEDLVQFYLRSSVIPPRVKAALEEALALRAKLAAVQTQIANEQKALKAIEEDQDRMRKNMERVPPTSEAYKRYLKKFDDQETEIEKRRAQLAKLQETDEQQTRAYEDYVANLNVE